MRDPVRHVNELLSEAAELSNNRTRVELTERAVRIADGIPDPDLAFDARLELVTCATFAGMPERSLVAFSWLLARCEAEPERFDIEQLLFPYRWIVEDIPYLLSVESERVDALIDDMERRYREQWWWEHPVAEARLRWAIVRGAPATEVEVRLEEWRRQFDRSGNPRGGHEVHATTTALSYLERWKDAIQVALPSLDGALPAAEEYPARTFAAVLEPARRLGRPERRIWRGRAAELCAPNPVFIREVSAVVDDFVRDREEPPELLLDRLAEWIESSFDDYGIMLAAAALARCRGDEPMARRALELARRFDTRHGNDRTTRLVRARIGPG